MSRCEQNGHYLSSDGGCVHCDYIDPESRAAYLKVAGVVIRQMFVVLRAVGEDTQAVAVAFNRQAADTEVSEAAARDLRCYGPHPHGGGWEGCYEVVEVPIVGLKEPA